ncbi:hypothetical protein E2C01_069456 [Portunus trituberculatus]|uniref:Uncharacterized protein n=1 Tax=Portunus trituberculatus TaxID=210409 RepID=A0A5B7HUK4_PORTR|nr:hypothetical protein [Portunus trituberculatus]
MAGSQRCFSPRWSSKIQLNLHKNPGNPLENQHIPPEPVYCNGDQAGTFVEAVQWSHTYRSYSHNTSALHSTISKGFI